MPMKSWTTSNSNNAAEERWDEKVRIGSLTKRYKQMRPVGGFWPYAQHWFEIYSKKQERKVKFPLICSRFNPETESYEHDRECAACDAHAADPDAGFKPQKVNAANFIDRDLQTKKDPNPIVVLRLNYTQTQDIEGIVDVIKRDPADPEGGVDLAMKYDTKLSGKDRYSIKRGDDAPLSKAEKSYELFDLDEIIVSASPSRIQDAVTRMLTTTGGGGGSTKQADAPKRTRRASPPKTVYTDDDEEIVGIPNFDDENPDDNDIPF